MTKTFDTYCIDAADLDSARDRLEVVLPIRFALHESMFWGGDYYRFRSDALGEITIRRNHNSYTGGLNEPDFPDCQIIVSVNAPLDPAALAARLTSGGLRLLNRSVIDVEPKMNDSVKYLIPVGFYRELNGGKPYEPSLREAVQPIAGADEARVVRYLNAGELLIATGGVVSDVLEPKLGIIGPPHILTDGTYAWPAIFAHYVERHHVRPPEEFVSHMHANHWTVPSVIDLPVLKVDRGAHRERE